MKLYIILIMFLLIHSIIPKESKSILSYIICAPIIIGNLIILFFDGIGVRHIVLNRVVIAATIITICICLYKKVTINKNR